MQKNRLEAFSDGVIAIIITIMVLEIKAPHEASLYALLELGPVFLSYVISSIYIGIYWNNHHHLLHAAHKVNGKILWANLFLLFWLSLIPFATAWMGENSFESITVTLYGIILFLAAFAYYVLTKFLLESGDERSVLKQAVGNKFKERISLSCYAVALIISIGSL